MIALIMFLFIAGGQQKPAKTQPKAPKVDCEYYRCNDSIVTSGGLYKPAQELCVGDYSGEWTCTPEVLPGIQQKPPTDGAMYIDPPYTYTSSDDTSESLAVQDGSKVVMLSAREYAHLQELRKAVADEEKRLAVKYGAAIDQQNCGYQCDVYPDRRKFDHIEYHGQFLLIQKASEEGKR